MLHCCANNFLLIFSEFLCYSYRFLRFIQKFQVYEQIFIESFPIPNLKLD